MTRPARSSSTAGSGMPATMALTAADSTGLTPRTSSRDADTLCKRHGTSAAAAMQANTATARIGDNSPNVTSAANAMPAAIRMMAECRSRSGHGEKKDDEEESSIAIRPALFPLGSVSSGAGIPALSHVHGFVFWSPGPSRRPPQALQPSTDDNLPKRQ